MSSSEPNVEHLSELAEALFSNLDNQSPEVGDFCYELATQLFPICRSLTGPGVRETLTLFSRLLPGLKTRSVPSGSQAFDWTVPDEWKIREAYIEDESGNRVVDFADHNLHVMGYSEPVDAWLNLDALQEKLFSLPEQPDAIPYITSYYRRNWGFCISDNQRQSLKPGNYHVVIDSELYSGELNYAEMLIPGESQQEILLSTYVCHPSMANNELSGPVVVTALARWLMGMRKRRYSYRILFLPETIGSIVYLSKNLDYLKQNLLAGFAVTCIGDDRTYSFLPSRNGNTVADRAARYVLRRY